MVRNRIIFIIGFSSVLMSSQLNANDIKQDDLFRAFSENSISEIAQIASDHRLVLLGESTHGTSEYYSIRAELSKVLIEEYGFRFIAVEGDWTPAWKVNAYIKHFDGAPASASEALSNFTRWPGWLWNNKETLELVEWLREYNASKAPEDRVGFYGIDVYSFWDSLDEAARVSDKLGDETEAIVNDALDCLLRFNRNHQRYINTVGQTGQHCGRQLATAVNRIDQIEKPDAFTKEDWFYFVSNMHVLLQGEMHYRGMLYQGPSSWNERARNFKLTVSRIKDFYPGETKGIVWAHNTHIGDARATDMGNFGLFNIGQLAAVHYGRENIFSIGFGTFAGTVIAGRAWDTPMEKMTMPPARSGSLEYWLNENYGKDVWFNLSHEKAGHYFENPVFQRAVGVIYNPEDERGNYVETYLLRRYHLFIFKKETSALRAF